MICKPQTIGEIYAGGPRRPQREPTPTDQHGVAGGEAGLREAFRNADARDWDFLDLLLGQSGHGKFWRAVISEVRAVLASTPRQPSPVASGEQEALTLTALRQANIDRQNEWCHDQHPDLSYRGNELGGEVGEALNTIKKLERERLGWCGSRSTVEALAEELADVVICADLCAITAGIDLDAAVVAKFNATSDKVGISVRLPASLAVSSPPAEMAGVEEGDLCAALDFLDGLIENAEPGERRALNPIILGGSARIAANVLRSALRTRQDTRAGGVVEREEKAASYVEGQIAGLRQAAEFAKYEATAWGYEVGSSARVAEANIMQALAELAPTTPTVTDEVRS